MADRRARPPDWYNRILLILAVSSFLLGLFGFWHYHGRAWAQLPDALYRTFALYFMAFDLPDAAMGHVNWAVQIARFGAFFTAVWAIVKALFPQVRRFISLLWARHSPACAVILGYGPVGQAIGAALWDQRCSAPVWAPLARRLGRPVPRGCDITRVTAVHPVVTPDMAARARLDKVLLIQGDPSDPRVLQQVHVGYARRIYVSDADDLQAIDTAVAARAAAGPDHDLRVVLNDSAVAGRLAEAAGAGFLGAPGVRWWSLADETARQLIAAARFDRIALERRAGRMHLAILGCGQQGEAVAVEAH